MLSKWPIRNKLLIGLSLLLVIICMLSWGGIHGLYAYRSLVKSLSRRVAELPLANELNLRVSDLRVSLSETRSFRSLQPIDQPYNQVSAYYAREEFRTALAAVEHTLNRYHAQLSDPESGSRIVDSRLEWQTVAEIEMTLQRIHASDRDEDWILDQVQVDKLDAEVNRLQRLSSELPTHLHKNISEFTENARSQYRTLIVLTWITSVTTAVMVGLLLHWFYHWVFRPLRVLIKGSRKVAAGHFRYRIRLDTEDEMAELAGAMNDMTARFQAIRDDLDRQVQERTKQVVRSEKLASVGFLAAGVAHEINNPLASIAMCAESLESRVQEIVDGEAGDPEVVISYLQMIQSEAFRCKGITERLLDYSRMGPGAHTAGELRELVQGVIEMIGHLGRYQEKTVELLPGEPVLALMNAQEMKQVVLNLLTNALDSLDDGGRVEVAITGAGDQALITITDNGCGMTPEVLEHLFEPFFTRRRGGQGTGLGLSIVYRIVADHDGAIDATSDGPGTGSQFRVRLPLAASHKEVEHRYQAA